MTKQFIISSTLYVCVQLLIFFRVSPCEFDKMSIIATNLFALGCKRVSLRHVRYLTTSLSHRLTTPYVQICSNRLLFGFLLKLKIVL